MYTAEIKAKQGWTGRLVYPDGYALFVEAGDIPDSNVMAVIDLLRGEGSIPKQDMIQKVQGDVRHYTRLYRLAALCLEYPKLILMRRKCSACGNVWDSELKTCDQCMENKSTPIYDRKEGEIGPRDLTFVDLISIQNDFFWTAATEIGPSDAQNIGGLAGDLSGGDGVPSAAE